MASGVFNLKHQLFALAQKAWSGQQKTNFVEYLVVAGGGGGRNTYVPGGGAGAGGPDWFRQGLSARIVRRHEDARLHRAGHGAATGTAAHG